MSVNIITLHQALFNTCIKKLHSDGCNISEQTDLDIGESIEVPCPCHDYLQIIPGVRDQKAKRVCGGTYKDGAQLQKTDRSQCTTIARGAALGLCFAAMVCINLYKQ